MSLTWGSRGGPCGDRTHDQRIKRSTELVLPGSTGVDECRLTWGFAVSHVGRRRPGSLHVEQNGHHNGHQLQGRANPHLDHQSFPQVRQLEGAQVQDTKSQLSSTSLTMAKSTSGEHSTAASSKRTTLVPPRWSALA